MGAAAAALGSSEGATVYSDMLGSASDRLHDHFNNTVSRGTSHRPDNRKGGGHPN